MKKLTSVFLMLLVSSYLFAAEFAIKIPFTKKTYDEMSNVALSGTTLISSTSDGKVDYQNFFKSEPFVATLVFGLLLYMLGSFKTKLIQVVKILVVSLCALVMILICHPVDVGAYFVCIGSVFVVPIVAPLVVKFMRIALYLDKTPSVY